VLLFVVSPPFSPFVKAPTFIELDNTIIHYLRSGGTWPAGVFWTCGLPPARGDALAALHRHALRDLPGRRLLTQPRDRRTARTCRRCGESVELTFFLFVCLCLLMFICDVVVLVLLLKSVLYRYSCCTVHYSSRSMMQLSQATRMNDFPALQQVRALSSIPTHHHLVTDHPQRNSPTPPSYTHR